MSVRTTTLPNGLRIVSHEMPHLQTVSLGVWVHAGARNETLEQHGIAHFLEHMAFKGTTSRSALQIAEAIEDVGGYINAYTSRETTAYYVRVLEEDVPLALDVMLAMSWPEQFYDAVFSANTAHIMSEDAVAAHVGGAAVQAAAEGGGVAQGHLHHLETQLVQLLHLVDF